MNINGKRHRTNALCAIAISLVVAVTGCAKESSAKADDPPARDIQAEREAAEDALPDLPESTKVEILDVIDATTYEVKARDAADPVHGDDPFTVSVTGVIGPDEGECGYEQARDQMKDYFFNQTHPFRKLIYDADRPIVYDGAEETYQGNIAPIGSLQSASAQLISEGWAAPDEEADPDGNWDWSVTKARNQRVGLYGICPEFNAE